MYSHNTLAQICEKRYVNYYVIVVGWDRMHFNMKFGSLHSILIEIPFSIQTTKKKIEVYE